MTGTVRRYPVGNLDPTGPKTFNMGTALIVKGKLESMKDFYIHVHQFLNGNKIKYEIMEFTNTLGNPNEGDFIIIKTKAEHKTRLHSLGGKKMNPQILEEEFKNPDRLSLKDVKEHLKIDSGLKNNDLAIKFFNSITTQLIGFLQYFKNFNSIVLEKQPMK